MENEEPSQQRELLVPDDVTDVCQTTLALCNLKLESDCKKWVVEIEKLNLILNQIDELKKKRKNIKLEMAAFEKSIEANKQMLKFLKNSPEANIIKKATNELLELQKHQALTLNESLSTTAHSLQLKIAEYEKQRDNIKVDFPNLVQNVLSN